MATQKTHKTKILMTNGSLMKVKSIADCPVILLTCIKAIIGLENHFFVSMRVAVLHRFYCIVLLKIFFENVAFENNQQTTKKQEIFPGRREGGGVHKSKN